MVKSVPRAVYIFHINKRGFEQIRNTFDSPLHIYVVGVFVHASEWSYSILKDKSKNDVLRDYVHFMQWPEYFTNLFTDWIIYTKYIL